MNKPIFIMMVGIVGSGKYKYEKKLAQETNVIICR